MNTNIAIAPLFGAYCVTPDDGSALFVRVREALEQGHTVTLEFLDVRVVSAAFLNAAFGRIFTLGSPEALDARVRVCGLWGANLDLLRHVLENIWKLHTNPAFRRAVESAHSTEE